MFVLSQDKFLFSATNVQRVLDTRERQCLVRPGSVEIEFNPEGRVTKCRAQTLVYKYLDELAYEYTLVSVPKLIAAWDAFRKRVDLTGYRRKVDIHNRRIVVQSVEDPNRTYNTTIGNCDCGSFKAQLEARDYLSQYIPDFESCCKHMSFLRAVEAHSNGTQCFWCPDSDPSMIKVFVWPGADDLKHPSTGKVCRSGEVTFWGKYPLSRLDELHHVAIARNWKFTRYYEYGVPLLAK